MLRRLDAYLAYGLPLMMYATQYRESYPYYQHEKIGFNYRMSNICAGIGRGQMTIVNDHIAHHKHVQALYEELLKDVKGIKVHGNPDSRYDSNFWLCTMTIDPEVRIKGQENAYKTIVTGAVGGAAGVIHANVTVSLRLTFLFDIEGGSGMEYT